MSRAKGLLLERARAPRRLTHVGREVQVRVREDTIHRRLDALTLGHRLREARGVESRDGAVVALTEHGSAALGLCHLLLELRILSARKEVGEIHATFSAPVTSIVATTRSLPQPVERPSAQASAGARARPIVSTIPRSV